MKNAIAFTILLVFAFICIAYAMDPRHTAWNGCNCQCGGERGEIVGTVLVKELHSLQDRNMFQHFMDKKMDINGLE
ncbi:hypothetical protein Ocin01_04556 [Orchesella cincta]|uniref:Uncharacterized protein n=1 Tax=Orchesella cincta TaxID=48709 RepID=A0A1D2NAM6_ORCCI|nr:hypothetical protein Ocin01_04556 [Orchesella cincta]